MTKTEHGNGKANENTSDWKAFREETLGFSKKRNNEEYLQYASSMTDRAWQHVLSENHFTPEAADKRLWGFFEADQKIKDLED